MGRVFWLKAGNSTWSVLRERWFLNTNAAETSRPRLPGEEGGQDVRRKLAQSHNWAVPSSLCALRVTLCALAALLMAVLNSTI